MRNNKLKDIRAEWQGSRFFFGKNKIAAIALGKTKETEIADGISELALRLKGQCALLFTNEKQKKVIFYFINLFLVFTNIINKTDPDFIGSFMDGRVC